jgi:protein-tyrosine phosphatase
VLDLHFVAPGLAVGAAFPTEAAARLARDHLIDHVVDVRSERRDDEQALRAHGIRLLHLPTDDTRAVPGRLLSQGVAFAAAALDAGSRVLIHCQYGIGRSPMVALCVLVARGDSPLEAMARLKDARPVSSPSPEQLAAFVRFSTALREERGAAFHLPTVEELGAIAWRHLRGAATDDDDARSASTRAE